MRRVELLDCTLRDGAYLLQKKFGNTNIKGIISGLIDAKINIIEIGFLQNEGNEDGSTVYKNSREASKLILGDKKESIISVLADYSRYDISNLDDYDGKSVDLIRECFFKHEYHEAIQACKIIKEKGYKVFVQPVDILGYSDKELLELLDEINQLEPDGMSIVDTFGSMYQEDLHRVFEIINHNLLESCKIGFHSHNNMQLSNALSQEFVRISSGKRKIVIDGTISGMGRGAGNTPIELIAQYLVSKYGYSYDMDKLLDLIDTYMDNIRSRCNWGYTTSYFVAGCYSAHVNNIDYLSKKNSIRHKDIGLILNKIGSEERKRYNYDLLEQTYIEMMKADIDDTAAICELRHKMENKKVLVLIPGMTISTKRELIDDYIEENKPYIISVNFIHENIKSDYIYLSNVKRYQYWSNSKKFLETNKILTSNLINNQPLKNSVIVSFTRLVKRGWKLLDNSTIMLLRLLDEINVSNIAIAGFDGYFNREGENVNYYDRNLEVNHTPMSALDINKEISGMLLDFYLNRKSKSMSIEFITPSRFKKLIDFKENV